MHVLLTNDDGPLNDTASPYIHYLVSAIAKHTNWDLSIVVPNTQRSWIGKAHFAGQNLTASFIYPTGDEESTTYLGPFAEPQEELRKQYKEWSLIDGTPASCSDIGIHHLYQEKGPVDLVISGPNVGRNSSATYITSSGTVGAAMEASLAGKLSIGLSYAFETRELKPDELREASLIAVKLIEHLYQNWGQGVDLYSINVPLHKELKLGQTKIHYAPILENKWGSIFKSQSQSEQTKETVDIVDVSVEKKIQFKWAPDFNTVHQTVLASAAKGEWNDSVALLNNCVSVTPLKAIFKDVAISGEIKLEHIPYFKPTVLTKESSAIHQTIPEQFQALQINPIEEELVLSIPTSSYIYPALQKSLSDHLPYLNIVSKSQKAVKTFQYGDYEDLDFDRVHSDSNYLINSYIYRKALIRKHYLANTIHIHTVKNPSSILRRAFPESFNLEVDYAEFLEDSLDECYELRDEINKGDSTWILKPSMSDRGQGIRLFQTIDQLQTIFDSFEEEDTDAEGEECTEGNNGVITSQLRHFIVQKYIADPLILSEYQGKKFHLRVYVLASGDLEVFVYKKMLTLFAASPYTDPNQLDLDTEEEVPMFGHLTNTCLQGEETATVNNSVVEFWQLQGLTITEKELIFSQIKEITGELFKAASTVDKINFQPLGNAFELYGLDFIVDSKLQVHVLEINAFPDFKQTGDDLKGLIFDLCDGLVTKCVVPFFNGEVKEGENDKEQLLVSVLKQ
ncbi:hypothetical protein WICPIJ_006513 [Wickerhamomyces pijperi]|uniref:Survival protein SurE-like phosphatase/nucleotidase domain-containing protein n=1 Tax=Wickerhamomyces pijperi TaxID=599730 RepID=A0A9P8Q251_WICPI|nr:hypothetical protein WICPIJ_006513 [Wickerhamomyces pijperi]